MFFDRAWTASAHEKGTVWFFPAVDEVDRWDESQVDRAPCGWTVPQYWCAPVEISRSHLNGRYVYGAGWTGPFGVGITAGLPRTTFSVWVRDQSIEALGFGVDCPAEDRSFPVHAQSFTVVAVDSRAYRILLQTWRYCPATSVLGVVSYAPGRKPAQRAFDLADARTNHASLRVAALEALARSPDSDGCPEVRDLVRRIQDRDPSRRVRDYARERWPRDRLEAAPTARAACWQGRADLRPGPTNQPPTPSTVTSNPSAVRDMPLLSPE